MLLWNYVRLAKHNAKFLWSLYIAKLGLRELGIGTRRKFEGTSILKAPNKVRSVACANEWCLGCDASHAIAIYWSFPRRTGFSLEFSIPTTYNRMKFHVKNPWPLRRFWSLRFFTLDFKIRFQRGEELSTGTDFVTLLRDGDEMLSR